MIVAAKKAATQIMAVVRPTSSAINVHPVARRQKRERGSLNWELGTGLEAGRQATALKQSDPSKTRPRIGALSSLIGTPMIATIVSTTHTIATYPLASVVRQRLNALPIALEQANAAAEPAVQVPTQSAEGKIQPL